MKFFVESYGCTMNHGEGHTLAMDMASLGFIQTSNADDADIVILNTCTVVETTEKHMLSRISELRTQGKQIVVTGCMAKAQPSRISLRLPNSLLVTPEDYGSFKDKIVERYGIQGCPTSVDISSQAILPIAQGCLGRCSYCITKFARGDLTTYPSEALLKKFDSMLFSGSKEILITAQDTSAYGNGSPYRLPELVKEMLTRSGEYRIRLGMADPASMRHIWDGLVPNMDDDRLYKFVHIPVQSGSNTILRSMRRKYTVERFMELVDRMRSDIPNISIATDVICGFPGETDDDHQRSLDLVKDLRADTVNITRFSPRPGTDASKMPQIHGRISSQRSAELTNVKNAVELDNNSKLIGKTFTAISSEVGKEGVILRTNNYRPIVVRSDIPLGTIVEVIIREAKPTYLLGDIRNT